MIFIGNKHDHIFYYDKLNDTFYYGNQLNVEFNFEFKPNKISSFIELSEYNGWQSLYNELKLFYNIYDIDANYIKNYASQKQLMRTILENAIRTSVAKYMPAETTLWKIKYSRKIIK